jgi:hypothetical protein
MMMVVLGSLNRLLNVMPIILAPETIECRLNISRVSDTLVSPVIFIKIRPSLQIMRGGSRPPSLECLLSSMILII